MREHDVHIICSRDAHDDFFLHAAVFQYLVCKAVLVCNSYARNKTRPGSAMSLLGKLEKAFSLSDV